MTDIHTSTAAERSATVEAAMAAIRLALGFIDPPAEQGWNDWSRAAAVGEWLN